MGKIRCGGCGGEVFEQELVCPWCGAPVRRARSTEDSRAAAGERGSEASDGAQPVPPVRNEYVGSSGVCTLAIESANDAQVRNWLLLASAAEAASNHAEAYDFFTKVLERDPFSSAGWFGKGLNAGWQSTLASMRLPELVDGVMRAVELCPLDDKARVAGDGVAAIRAVVEACFALSRNHCVEFSSVEGVYSEHLGRLGMMCRALEAALELVPNDAGAQEDLFTLNRMMHASSSPCFVATAVLGKADHRVVVLLRRFRAEQLSGSPLGIAFLEWYGFHGPRAADLIAKSGVRRAVALWCVVLPVAVVAWAVMAASHARLAYRPRPPAIDLGRALPGDRRPTGLGARALLLPLVAGCRRVRQLAADGIAASVDQ